ncbi:MAG: hypothetical protein AAGC55_32830, partial [Myxococcota bacterium]
GTYFIDGSGVVFQTDSPDMAVPQARSLFCVSRAEATTFEQARALETGLQGAQGDLGERARVVYSGGKSIHVARESGRWRLESATLSEVHSGRPQDAVRLLATALQGRDYRSVLRLLTKRRREGLDRQLDDFVRSLLEHLDSGDNTIEVLGDDRAELRWGDGDRRYKIVLRKEDNEWRIDDIHLRPVPSKPDGEEPTR